MDLAAATVIQVHAQLGMSTKVGDAKSFRKALNNAVNAQNELACVRALFQADCAARATRTAQNAEKHFIRIQVARAEVTRHKLNAQHVTFNNWNILRSGKLLGVCRQPAGGRYIGIVTVAQYIGLRSPSSCSKLIYGSLEEWYAESPASLGRHSHL